MTRTFGLDIHKRFAEVALLRPGSQPPLRLRLPARPAAIRAFAARLGPRTAWPWSPAPTPLSSTACCASMPGRWWSPTRSRPG